MATIDDLKTWFERDIKFATWAENAQVTEAPDATGNLEIRFYTDTNEYLLRITSDDEETAWVDCLVRARKARAGLPSPRVRSLLRGTKRRLNERVWHRILGAIVGMELVRVHRRETLDEPGEPAVSSRDAA